MPIYEYECNCGKIQEAIFPINECPETVTCVCGDKAYKIITWAGHYTGNQDSGWLKSVRQVVSKDPTRRHCQDFLKNPTRHNYQSWMKGEGLRPLENREKTEPEKTSLKELQRATTEKFIERNRLNVGGL